MIIHGRNITMKTSSSDPEVMCYPWLGEGIFSFHFNLLSPSLSGCWGPGESSACGSSTTKDAASILVMVFVGIFWLRRWAIYIKICISNSLKCYVTTFNSTSCIKFDLKTNQPKKQLLVFFLVLTFRGWNSVAVVLTEPFPLPWGSSSLSSSL